MKKVKTILLEVVLGAVMYYLVATGYYHCTGDSHNSGMTAVRACIIYAILLTGARYVSVFRRLHAKGELKSKAHKRNAMEVYACLLLAVWSIGVFYFLKTEAYDDALISAFFICVFIALICAILCLCNFLTWRSNEKERIRVEESRKRYDLLYGGANVLRYDYKLIEIYCTNIVAKATEIFGEDFELLPMLGSDASLWERAETLRAKYGFIPVSEKLEDIRNGINEFCARMGYGISISDEELAAICEKYDNAFVKARRRDGVLTYPHDMALLSELLRGKGYELYKLSCEGCCSEWYDEEDCEYDEDGEPILKAPDPNSRPTESCGKYAEDDDGVCITFLTVAKLHG